MFKTITRNESCIFVRNKSIIPPTEEPYHTWDVQDQQEPIKTMKTNHIENPQVTTVEDAEDVTIWSDSCHEMISDALNMKRVAEEFVPKLLHFYRKISGMSIDQELLDDISYPDLFKSVIK